MQQLLGASCSCTGLPGDFKVREKKINLISHIVHICFLLGRVVLTRRVVIAFLATLPGGGARAELAADPQRDSNSSPDFTAAKKVPAPAPLFTGSPLSGSICFFGSGRALKYKCSTSAGPKNC